MIVNLRLNWIFIFILFYINFFRWITRFNLFCFICILSFDLIIHNLLLISWYNRFFRIIFRLFFSIFICFLIYLLNFFLLFVLFINILDLLTLNILVFWFLFFAYRNGKFLLLYWSFFLFIRLICIVFCLNIIIWIDTNITSWLLNWVIIFFLYFDWYFLLLAFWFLIYLIRLDLSNLCIFIWLFCFHNWLLFNF